MLVIYLIHFHLWKLYLKVKTRALDGVGTNLAVGDGDVIGVNGIALEGFFTFEGAVEHHIGI